MYFEVYSKIKSLIYSLYGINWNPKIIHVDLEQARIKILEILFPNSTLLSCYFHDVSNWWEIAGKEGLKKDEKIDKTKILI